MLGSLTQIGQELQVSASLYDTSGELLVENVQMIPSEDSILAAAGGLLNAFLGSLVDWSAPGLTSLGGGMSDSFPATKAYLLAEEAHGAGRFQEAMDLTAEALAHDSTFAAAWYLGANSRAEWSRPDTRRFRMGSRRHAANAPLRLQMLIEARAQVLEQDVEGVLRKLRAVLALYPDDMDAIAFLADQTYHRAPWKGEPATAAIPGFYRILEFDPDNGEYLSHLSHLLYRDRRFEELSSLYQSFAQSPDVPQAREVTLYYRLSSPDRESYLDSLIAGPPRWVFAELLAHDLDAALSELKGWADRLGEAGNGLLRMAHRVGSIAGQHTGLAQMLNAVGRTNPDRAVLTRAQIAAFQPYLPASTDSLTRVVAALDSVRTDFLQDAFETDFPRGPLEDDFLEGGFEAIRYPGDTRDFLAHLRMALFERMGDTGAMRTEWESLRQTTDPPRLTQNLIHEMEARVLFAEGSPRQALTALDQIEHRFSVAASAFSSNHDGLHARFLRARILFELGEYRNAIRWSQSVHDGLQLVFFPILLPFTYRLEAEAYAQLGDWDNAIERYQRFIDLWQDADQDLQPQVEEARRRMEQALQRSAAEPAA